MLSVFGSPSRAGVDRPGAYGVTLHRDLLLVVHERVGYRYLR